MRIIYVVFVLLPALLTAQPKTLPDQFLFGASVYPELQTREEWNRMLDLFQKAHMNVVRVSESSWGNLETGPGRYNFGWLKDFLDDAHRRGIKCILGTSSYIIPQWLYESNPDILMQQEPGVPAHSHSRHSVCLNHPVYRAAVRRYCNALGRAFKDHPAVIGWQLDNEIEHKLNRVCFNPACIKAWHGWLKKTYGTAEEFNRRLKLVSWGMEVGSLEKVMPPKHEVDGGLPALRLANLHFRRDTILEFLAEQTAALREAGVRQWITTDWNCYFTAIADDPMARQALDVAGLNFYQPSAENLSFFTDLAWHLDMHRSAHGLGHFMVTETRVGVAGSVTQFDPFPTKEQFMMWMFQPVAYGAFGLMYWSGNRWVGGHWPHWGGILDWSGQPEPDFPWLIELGGFYATNSRRLLDNPVKATAAVITDFNQRAALQEYPHTPASKKVLMGAFDELHRIGVGVDSINVPDAAKPEVLSKYRLLMIAAATALDSREFSVALEDYVEKGGAVIVSPFTAYMNWDGVFRSDGFGANLKDLTGAVVRTARRMGTAAEDRPDQRVVWTGAGMQGTSKVGIDGYVEYLDVSPGAEVIAKFQSNEPVLNGRPAATLRKTGKGRVVKLAFWPDDDAVARLARLLAPETDALLAAPAPYGVQAVPRSDKSLFVMNTSKKPAVIDLARVATDRISGKSVRGNTRLESYEVLWLE